MNSSNYFPEAELNPGGGIELEYKTSVDEWFQDTRYQILNSNVINDLLYRYDHDAYIRTVSHIYQSTLFAGGVLFCRGDAQMTPEATRWYDSTWSIWGMSLDRQIVSLGWSANTYRPHSEYVAVPVTLDLSQCTILYRLDVITGPHFVFFENLNTPSQHSIFLQQRNAKGKSPMGGMYNYIPNVVVFTETEPSSNGTIRSKVSVLSPDLDLDETLFSSTSVATRARANPTLILESIRFPHDPHAVVSTITPLNMMLGDGDTPMPGFTNPQSYDYNSTSFANDEEDEKRRYDYSSMLSKMGAGGIQAVDRRVTQSQSAAALRGPKEHYLQEGQKVANSTLAESPGELFLSFRVARMERVFNIFGIPLGMISQSSSLGNKTSMNENVFVVFINTQKQKKQQLLGFMHHMYDMIYTVHHALHRIANKEPKYGKDGKREQVGIKTDINILMTGMPEDIVLDQLYKMGALKYESFLKYTSSKHGIPLIDFNPACKMTLLDLNGIKKDKIGA